MKWYTHHLSLLIAAGICAGLCSCAKGSAKPKQTIVTVTTLAGTGSPGALNGSGTSASFTSPSSLSIGGSGQLYVCDFGNSLMRKVDLTSLVVDTYSGTGATGLVNGPAASAEFRGPSNILVDKQGNLFVSDEGNNVIREVTSSGNVLTLAGTGVGGHRDGAAAAAQFYYPEGMVLDANGNLYVAESSNNDIRKINLSTGIVTTYAGTGLAGFGNGPIAGATFHSPYGLAMDGNGDIYVADIVNNAIRKITVATGMVTTFAGTGAAGLTNGPASSATFSYPGGCAFDPAGDLFISELKNNTIRIITPDGVVGTFAGSGAQGYKDGNASVASFHQPLGLAVDAGGNVYVADEYNNVIRKITVSQQ